MISAFGYQETVRRAGFLLLVSALGCAGSISKVDHETELAKESAAAERRIRDAEAGRKMSEDSARRAEEACQAERRATDARVERLESALAEKQALLDALYAEGQGPAAKEKARSAAEKARAEVVRLFEDLSPSIQPEPGRVRVSFSMDLFFDAGGTRLTPSGEEKAQEIAVRLSRLGASRVVLEVHGDRVTDALRMSALAGVELAERLISLGVDGGRLSVRGVGNGEPRTSDASRAARAKDRRIVLVIGEPGVVP
ncbi:MAG: hypothetical protein U1E65_12880 [Myxococcota bacterium]